MNHLEPNLVICINIVIMLSHPIAINQSQCVQFMPLKMNNSLPHQQWQNSFCEMQNTRVGWFRMGLVPNTAFKTQSSVSSHVSTKQMA